MAVEEREGGVRTASETPMLMATAVAISELKVVLLSRLQSQYLKWLLQ